jgi:hypothetical protein
LIDHHTGIALGARLHPLDRGFAILDREYVDTLLIGNERGMRDHYFLVRLPGFEFDPNKLSVDERAVRIREYGARQDGVGATIDLDIDKVDAAFPLVRPAISGSEGEP